MNKYFFTFGQHHKHPQTGKRMADHWIEIVAVEREDARAIMCTMYGLQWGFQYEADEFEPNWFPAGRYDLILQRTPYCQWLMNNTSTETAMIAVFNGKVDGAWEEAIANQLHRDILDHNQQALEIFLLSNNEDPKQLCLMRAAKLITSSKKID